MVKHNVLLEAIGLGEIHNNILSVFLHMIGLLGDKKLGVRSEGDYQSNASNGDITDILSSIADKVNWNNAIRGCTSDKDAQRRYVFAVASVIPRMMAALRDIANKQGAKGASEYFSTVYNAIARKNPYRECAEIFYQSLLDSFVQLTPTRPGQSSSENISSSNQINELLDKCKARYYRIRENVNQIIDATIQLAAKYGIDLRFNEEDYDRATEWLMAIDVLKKGYFSAEKDHVSWFRKDLPIPQFLYNLVKYSWSNTGEDQGTVDTVDSSNVDTFVVKDMSNLGDNTKQINTLTPQSKFTCEKYYKVFTVDGIDYINLGKNTPIELAELHVLKYALNNLGYNSGIQISQDTYKQFAAYVKKLFASLAVSTVNALQFHGDMVDQLETIVNICEEGSDKEKQKLLSDLSYGSISKQSLLRKQCAVVKSAIDKIYTDIIFNGSYSIEGQLLDGSDVSAFSYPEPVHSFGEDSLNERKTTMDRSESGLVTTRYFEYESTADDDGNNADVLKVGYNDERGEHDIDVIPASQIRDVYDTYVSTALVPVHVSKSYAWIVLCGIKCYSRIVDRTLDDVQQLSPITKSQLDMMTNANVYNASKMSTASRVAAAINNTDWDNYAKAGFIDPSNVENGDARMMVIRKAGDVASSSDLKSLLTKVVKVGDAYTEAITNYINRLNGGSGFLEGDLRRQINEFTPSVNSLMTEGHVAIDTMLIKYAMATSNKVNVSTTDAITELSSLYSAYNILNEYKDALDPNNQSSSISMYAFAQDFARCGNTLNKVLNSDKVPDDAKMELRSLCPEKYVEIVGLCAKLTEKLLDKTIKTSVKRRMFEDPKVSQMMKSGANALLSVDWNTVVPNVINMIGQSGADIVNSDPDLRGLKNSLYNVVDMIPRVGLTPSNMFDVRSALASCLIKNPPDGTDNSVNGLGEQRINTFMRKAKRLNHLIGIYETTQTAVSNNDEVTRDLFDIPDSNDADLGNLDPYGVENKDARRLHELRGEINDERTVSNNPNMNATDGHNVETLITCVFKLKQENDYIAALERSKEGLTQYARMTLNDPNADYTTLQSVSDGVSMQLKSKASQLDSRMQYATTEQTILENELKEFIADHPSFEGLADALQDNTVSIEDLEYALRVSSIASEQLNELVKYDTVQSDVDNPAFRMYAYTKSDESAIAEIIYILGMHLVAPNSDSKDDLVDTLTNVHDILTRYSGNLATTTVSKYVLGEISNVSGDKELAAKIVSILVYLGRFVVTRLSNAHGGADSRFLTAIENIPTPQQHSADYGKAMDSYARSQLRERGNKKSSKEKTTKGRHEDEERSARQAYIQLLRNDLNENKALAKYAYVLGRAFDTFERTMTDERVASVENRMFNSVRESLAGVELWKGRAVNDLQREVVSAIIDDEANGDSTYPTVLSVLNAAMTGNPVQAYNQMYSDEVYSGDPEHPNENILYDRKGTSVAFDINGNRVPDGQPGVELTPDRIYKLLFTRTATPDADDSEGSEISAYDENNVRELVRDVRLELFYRIVESYGSFVDDVFEYNDSYKDKATELMTDALNSLKKLCEDLTTPLSSIVVATSSVGQRNGRDIVLDVAKKSLGQDTMDDLDTIGLVSDEPGAYPQTLSNEKSNADIDWIDNIARLISLIPDELSPADVNKYVGAYFTSETNRRKIASIPEGAVLIKVIEHMMELDDNATGIPSGFFGNDSKDKAEKISRLFKVIASASGDTWKERAQTIKDKFVDMQETGRNVLSVGNILPTDAARKRIAHLRMNPYYATRLHPIDSDEYKSAVEELISSKLVTVKPDSNYAKLAYGNKTLDKNTFTYMVMMTVNYAEKKSLPIADAFATVVMFYLSGVRSRAYDALLDEVDHVLQSEDVMNKPEVKTSVDGISEAVNATHVANMIKTDLGWFTVKAFNALCVKAILSGKDLISDFQNAVAELTAGGKTSVDDLDAIKLRPDDSVVKPEEEPVSPAANSAPGGDKSKENLATEISSNEEAAPVSSISGWNDIFGIGSDDRSSLKDTAKNSPETVQIQPVNADTDATDADEEIDGFVS